MKSSPALISAIQTNNSTTLNGCRTNSSSESYLVDLFFQIASMRNSSEDDIIRSFSLALSEDPLSAMKILFWSRDIRGGQGERKTFRIILKNLSKTNRSIVEANLDKIPYFGRWDDLFCLFNTSLEDSALSLIEKALLSQNKAEASLCAKWMPREKSSKRVIARKIMSSMNLSPKKYRKLLSGLTNVVENKMCSNEWNSIQYESVPSVAMLRNRKAFERNSPETWRAYSESLALGNSSVNSKTLHPHQIALCARRGDDFGILNAQWESLPNYLLDNPHRIISVVDTSGSMYSGYNDSFSPIDVSVSLGLYISERTNGPFKNFFITFSESPSIVKVTGNSLEEKLSLIRDSEWGYNTNLESVFSLILDKAVQSDIAEEDMPNMILIISDMEFDSAVSGGKLSAIDSIRSKYFDAGYELPKIVFWNVNARPGNIPVKFDDNGTAMISGFSPSIMKVVLSEKDISPANILKNVIDSPRYSCVSI